MTNPIRNADAATILSGQLDWADPEVAGILAHHPLDSIETEYPHFVRSVEGPDDTERPSERHPVFYGCFDWHSSVHSHWALVRQLRLFDEHPDRDAIVASADDRLIPANVEAEVDHLEANPAFEKPYGWAWLLHLAAELELWADPLATEWAATLEPLESTVRELVVSGFLTQDRPFRVGTHQNSAFALHCIYDYATVVGDGELATAVRRTALSWFGDDADYPVEYEPLGWDFLSPALAEADLLRRVLDGVGSGDAGAFEDWIEDFLPDVTASPYDSILDPIEVETDPEEELALHFVGLNLSRAWALAGIADALGDHRWADSFEDAARRHADAGLEQAFTEDYAGAHWLSSFVLYLCSRNEGGIAPTAD